MSDDLLRASALEAAERVRAGDLPAGELFSLYRRRIEELDERLGAFLWTADEPPEGDRDAPLGQVPLAVKDLFCTEDVPTTAGSRILEDTDPSTPRPPCVAWRAPARR